MNSYHPIVQLLLGACVGPDESTTLLCDQIINVQIRIKIIDKYARTSLMWACLNKLKMVGHQINRYVNPIKWLGIKLIDSNQNNFPLVNYANKRGKTALYFSYALSLFQSGIEIMTTCGYDFKFCKPHKSLGKTMLIDLLANLQWTE